MSKQYQRAISAAVVAMCLMVAGQATAGSLDPTNAPGPTMHTLEEIYQKVQNLAPQTLQTLSSNTAVANAGYYAATNLTQVDVDLAAGNIATNVTIFGVAGTLSTTPAAVPKSGQTTSYATGDDGDLEKGVAWPNQRFTDNSDGTVTDNLTGLIWLKNASAFLDLDWATAVAVCRSLKSGEQGLTDGSSEGDWRLPSRRELFSLVDDSLWSVCLPSGHPFTGVAPVGWWTSTTMSIDPTWAWYVSLNGGFIYFEPKSNLRHAWPVRGGQ